MKVLVIKTTSMGDVIHTLPALTDAGNAISSIQFDWVVEKPFAEIPPWHPLVKNVIPCATRYWRKHMLQSWQTKELQNFYHQLRATSYDLVIDAQGLLKSALISAFARGTRVGLDFQSAWESIASVFYQKKCSVNPQQHAVQRVRKLFAAALGYSVPDSIADYGIDKTRLQLKPYLDVPYLVFLHGTTWATKHWPEAYWRQLAVDATNAGYTVLLPWGNDIEKERAEWITRALPLAEVLPQMKLAELTGVIAYAAAVVAVDTGLGHLAAAFSVPTITLYGPTDSLLTGTVGYHQRHLAVDFACAPCLLRECAYVKQHAINPVCFTTLAPEKVWRKLQALVKDVYG